MDTPKTAVIADCGLAMWAIIIQMNCAEFANFYYATVGEELRPLEVDITHKRSYKKIAKKPKEIQNVRPNISAIINDPEKRKVLKFEHDSDPYYEMVERKEQNIKEPWRWRTNILK
jgi:hypothetical protein